MKTRGVIGKRIVAIRQQVVNRGHGFTRANAVFAIVLEDGTELRPVTLEGEADYFTELVVARPSKFSRLAALARQSKIPT